jgi:vacuolar protein sorting-associated protein 13D
MRSVVKPHHSLPYAWDEPTLPPHITCTAPGGSSATYNMNVTGEGSQLTYENFIYIAMNGTFGGSSSSSGGNGSEKKSFVDDVEGQQLVLDVEGTKVFLSKKETGKRSQGRDSPNYS